MEANFKNRISQVAKTVKNLGTGGLVITSVANVSYLTGFLGDDSWAFMLGKRLWLLTDSRYTEQAQSECHTDCKIVQRKGAMADEIAKILGRNKSVTVIGIEDTTTLAEFAAVKKKVKVKIKKLSGVVREFRSIKDSSEVAKIQKASDIADKAYAGAIRKLRAGMTESELAGLLEFNMRKLGASVAFDTIVCFGANGSRNHHVPGLNKLRKNDTVLIDFGATYMGYRSDKTRSFAVGKAKRDFARAYQAVAVAQQTGIDMIAPGVKIAQVDAAVRDVIDKAGFPLFGHGLGHGIGLEVHELPTVSGRNKGTLQVGQIITAEPGIYIPGKFGIRIEDDVLVTDGGRKIISRCERMNELKIITLR